MRENAVGRRARLVMVPIAAGRWVGTVVGVKRDAGPLFNGTVARDWRHSTVEGARCGGGRGGDAFLGGGVLDGQVEGVLRLLDLGGEWAGPD